MRQGYKILFITFTFVFSLLFLFVTAQPANCQGLVMLAKKVTQDLPLDAEDAIWQTARSVEVPLTTQVMARPRTYESVIKNLQVKAVHNAKEVAFRLEWADPSEDIILDLDKFPDAVAMEFPSSSSTGRPHFGMGDEENNVNIWYWKSIWQTPKGQTQPTEEAVKAKEYAPHFRTDEKTHIFVDDFLTGTLAGNPVSTPGRSPVENLVARGFTTLTDNETEKNPKLSGFGRWNSDKWAVVFKRELASNDPFDVTFKEGTVVPVSFAVWNGAEAQRGGQKVLSTWYYVGLETEQKSTVYIYPIIAFLLAIVIEYGLILWIRSKRGVR
jgi:hypothetical protein